MKFKSFFTALLAMIVMAFAVPASAQYYGYIQDTVTNSTAITLYPGGTTSAGAASAAAAKSLLVNGNLDIIIYADSLSGSTAGTAYIEVANVANPNLWYPVQSYTVNGVQTTAHFEDTDFSNSKWRLRVTGGGTQSTKISAEWRFKPE